VYILKTYFKESSDLKMKFIENSEDKIIDTINIITNALKNGNKILICGNGGSAADSQHFAAEIVGRYKL
jgi:D-sedoheptulose 7-phosphate isomerase